MSDLDFQLQSALGGAYRVVRELGGGGMSRVFLAEETALGRQVVIKVLSPEMGAGVNKERFQREIQLAARLQHPLIVPLLTAGVAGDVLYYVMPYIEGESLRARLGREGELPVGEAVRLLRDIAEALAYAHGQDVVHRDIKPDNVLLSGKHALVTDFGVAKAVSASSGGRSSLTSLGVALGTPAYMAPEQAAGDPHVDARADLYAVGALAYEMLSGQPPFSAPTPQAMLAAQVTQAPDPIAARRTTVPPALNGLIMRCLEKKPADRWQRADELAGALETMATPTAGITPTGTRPVTISSGTEAAVRRAHPGRVLGLFAAAGLALVAVVYVLMLQLGLPGWVLTGTVGLLLVGLPIMIVTGIRERRRAIARTTGVYVTTPTAGLPALFTWRRAILGGVVAFAVLGVVTVGYSVMRAFGIGPVGTLMGAEVLKQQDRVLLADFASRGDTSLGTTLTEAFRVDLAQSRVVTLVDPRTVGEALQRMGRPAQTPLAPDVAREVAEREGIPAVITGQLDPVGSGFLLTANVISTADGRILTGVRASAADAGELIPALDRLSKDLRERIGESLKTIRETPRLDRVSTASLDALRKYSQAVRASDAGDAETAIALLEEATQIDTGFAMAWRKLAAVLGNAGASYDRQVDATRRAYAHRDRLPEIERQLTTAYYYYTVDRDPAKEVAAYRAVLDADPTNDIALNNLGIELADLHQYAPAESLLQRGVDLGYGGNYWLNLIRMQILQSKLDAAEVTWRRYAAAAPQDPNVLDMRATIESARGDFAAVARTAEELRAAQASSPRWRASASGLLGAAARVTGDLKEGRRRMREAMAEDERRALPGQYIIDAVNLATIDLELLDRPAAALDTVAAALRRYPLSGMPAADRPYTNLAVLYAGAGRVDEAQRLMSEYQQAVPEGVLRADPSRHLAAGAIAEARGRLRDAIAGYQAFWDELGNCILCGVFETARAYDKLNEADSAVVWYERWLAAPAPGRVFAAAGRQAVTYKRLGELYETKGDRQRALDYYGRLVEQWKNADPELQPVVKDAQARIQRLAGEH